MSTLHGDRSELCPVGIWETTRTDAGVTRLVSTGMMANVPLHTVGLNTFVQRVGGWLLTRTSGLSRQKSDHYQKQNLARVLCCVFWATHYFNIMIVWWVLVVSY